MAATTVPTQTSGSDSIQQRFINLESGIAGDVAAYVLGTSPWANALETGTFTGEIGDIVRNLYYERSWVGTTGEGTWADHRALGLSSAAAGNVPPDIDAATGRSIPPVSVVETNAIQRAYGLVWAAVESEAVDVRDAVFSYKKEQQFMRQYEKLVEASGYMWNAKLREAYFQKCEQKVCIGVPESGSFNTLADLTVTGPTSFDTLSGYTDAQLNATGAAAANGYSTSHSVLTNGVLEHIHGILRRQGAGRDSKLKGTNNDPSFPLVCSNETSRYLRHEPGMRSDLRYADAGSLLKHLGYTKDWQGYTHVIDDYCPRFTLAKSSTSAFTRVHPWTRVSGSISTAFTGASTYASGTQTQLTGVTSTAHIVAGSAIRIAPTSASDDEYSGNFTVIAITAVDSSIVIAKAFSDTATGTIYTNTLGRAGIVRNTSYDTAPYEMSFILHPGVMKRLSLEYPTSLGSGSSFDPGARIGDFKWVNEYERNSNPDKTIGFFRGIMEFAAEPLATEYGWAIMHRRADPVMLASPSYAVAAGMGWWS
jgi:hypothetical protein